MGIVGGTVGMLLSLIMIYQKSAEKKSPTTTTTVSAVKNVPTVAAK
jgi:hypothetical protein